MSQIKRMLFTLKQPNARATAIRVAIFVGTLLFSINHGRALLDGEMTGARWVSVLLTYCVPFMVSIHGQSQTDACQISS